MLLNVDAWNRAAEVWRAYVFAASWQSAVVALIAMGLTLLFRRWPAAVRAAILLVALVKFLVPPIVPSPAAVFGRRPPRGLCLALNARRFPYGRNPSWRCRRRIGCRMVEH